MAPSLQSNVNGYGEPEIEHKRDGHDDNMVRHSGIAFPELAHPRPHARARYLRGQRRDVVGGDLRGYVGESFTERIRREKP